jgi:hypothetical protein
MERSEIPHHPRYLGVPSSASKMMSEPMVRFDANRAPILRQDEHYLETKQNELSLEPCHVGVPSGASKMIYEVAVHLAQNRAPILHPH